LFDFLVALKDIQSSGGTKKVRVGRVTVLFGREAVFTISVIKLGEEI